jgi:protein Tex
VESTRSRMRWLCSPKTVLFIARYRKEKTGEMNEVKLRALLERHTYLTELEERKVAILKSIEEQGKLTDDLKAKIESCLQKTELEDLYLPCG